MFIGAVFIIARRWKQPKCPLIEGFIKKLQCIAILEHYSATEGNEVLTCVTVDEP